MNFSTMGKTQIHMHLGVKKVISLKKVHKYRLIPVGYLESVLF